MNYQNGGVLGGLNQSAGNLANAYSPSPATASQIEQRLMDLDGCNKALNEIISGFQVKLQTVLMPQMANEAKGQATPKSVVSPLADRLDAHINEHRHLTSILRDMYDRLAL